MKITLAKALNLKNRLVGQISKLQSQITGNNRVKEGREFKFDAKALLEKYLNITNNLISLKASLAIQNIDIYDKIYSIAEFKSMISFFQNQIITIDVE